MLHQLWPFYFLLYFAARSTLFPGNGNEVDYLDELKIEIDEGKNDGFLPRHLPIIDVGTELGMVDVEGAYEGQEDGAVLTVGCADGTLLGDTVGF
jgi:hypothetical protein